MQRRNLKQNTSPATHSSISATDADSAPDLRHLQAGVQVFTTKSSFEEYGGAAAEAASGNCEGFENSLPAISGEFPGRYCSSNPISSGDLGGCMTSMKDGIKVGTTELLTGVYAPGTPLVLIDPILTAIFGLTTSRGVAPYFAVDEAFIEFEGVNALSFEVVNAFASADSVTLDIWDVNGNPLGSIPAGADFVGIVSDTPIGRITLPAGPSTLEFLDNICFEPSSVTGEVSNLIVVDLVALVSRHCLTSTFNSNRPAATPISEHFPVAGMTTWEPVTSLCFRPQTLPRTKN